MNEGLHSCPACKSHSSEVVLSRCKDILYRCPGEWDLIECKDCQLIYTTPLLTKQDLPNYYPASYSPHNPATPLRNSLAGSSIRKIMMLPYQVRFGDPDWVERPFGQGRLLDIGCGAGTFLQRAIRLGWTGWGLDASSIAVKTAQKNAPAATVFHATLADLTLSESFEVIVMNQVLEHLPDPKESLQQCFDLLTPGGKIVIGVPNIGSVEAKVFGKRWIGLDVPRHVVHFREGTIRQLLINAGFSVLSIRPLMFASSISESMIMMLPECIRYRFLESRGARCLYLLMTFPAAVSYLLGNRSIIEVVAQRSETV